MSQKQKRKELPAYTKNKKAFDSVIRHLRRMGTPQLGAVSAMNFEKVGGSPSARNPIAPTPVDFKADVMLAIKAVMPRGILLKNFLLAYIFFDSDDEIECHIFTRRERGTNVNVL